MCKGSQWRGRRREMDRLVGIEIGTSSYLSGSEDKFNWNVPSPITATVTGRRSILKETLRLILVDAKGGKRQDLREKRHGSIITMSLMKDNLVDILLDRGDQKEREAREGNITTSRFGPTKDLQSRAARAGTRIGKSKKTAIIRHRDLPIGEQGAIRRGDNVKDQSWKPPPLITGCWISE